MMSCNQKTSGNGDKIARMTYSFLWTNLMPSWEFAGRCLVVRCLVSGVWGGCDMWPMWVMPRVISERVSEVTCLIRPPRPVLLSARDGWPGHQLQTTLSSPHPGLAPGPPPPPGFPNPWRSVTSVLTTSSNPEHSLLICFKSLFYWGISLRQNISWIIQQSFMFYKVTWCIWSVHKICLAIF